MAGVAVLADETRLFVVIEDEPQMRRFLRTVLPPQGFDVFEAETGARGLSEGGVRTPGEFYSGNGCPAPMAPVGRPRRSARRTVPRARMQRE